MRCPHEVCFQCLQTGHTSKECREGSSATFLQHVRAWQHPVHQLDVSQVRCLRCGVLGHVDCSPDDGRPKNLSCFNCGGNGHAALSCKEDGMDRWHRRFAPLAAPGGGRPGGGRPSIRQIHASNRPGPPPERFRNSTAGGPGSYAGRGGSNGRGGGSHGSNRDGGGGGSLPPAHQGGGGASWAPHRGRGAGGFVRPQGIVKPSANNHTRFR